MRSMLDNPVALVVEDDSDSLDTRRSLLTEFGFLAIGVTNATDALRELEAAPAIDIVITDINLVASEPKDRSGIELARKIKSLPGGIPVVGISNHFGENEISKADLDLFYARSLKGGTEPLDQMKAQIGQWRIRALEHRTSRCADAMNELARIKLKYRIRESDFAILTHFLSGSHLPSAALQGLGSEGAVEDYLDEQGITLHLIEAGTPIPLSTCSEGQSATLGATELRTKATIAIWVHRGVEGFELEVFGHPTLYAHGETFQEAIDDLLALIGGFYSDLSTGSPAPLSKELARLYDYLKHLIG